VITLDTQTVGGQAGPSGTGERPHALKRDTLGVIGVLFFVFSAQAPLTGIAGASPIAVAIGNGTGVPAAYLTAGLIVLLFSVGYVAMSRHVVHAGAFYAYVGKGLGRTTGIGGAMVALLAYCAIQAAMYGLYGASVSALLEAYLGIAVPWWVCVLVTMAVIQVLGALGVEIGARVLAVLVLAEFSLLLAFAVVTFFRGGGPEGLAPLASFGPEAVLSGAPGVAVMFAVASMFGFEATAIYGEEARQPHRTIPRATYTAVIGITAFFAFVTWMNVSAHGPSHAAAQAGAALEGGDGTAYVFGPIANLLGGWTTDVLQILLCTSLFAGMLAFHNSVTRYFFSLSRDGVLPAVLGRLNRHHSPAPAGALQTLIALVLVAPFALGGQDPVLTLFSWFSGLAVLSMMLLYLLTSISVFVFFRRERLDTRVWHTAVAPILGALGLASAIALILANFTTLIDGDTTTAIRLVLPIPVLFAAGVVLARVRKDVLSPHTVA